VSIGLSYLDCQIEWCYCSQFARTHASLRIRRHAPGSVVMRLRLLGCASCCCRHSCFDRGEKRAVPVGGHLKLRASRGGGRIVLRDYTPIGKSLRLPPTTASPQRRWGGRSLAGSSSWSRPTRAVK
jgi:hypothetical protein